MPDASQSTVEELTPQELTIPGLLLARAADFGNKPMFRFDGLERSFAQMPLAAAETGGSLRAAGIRPGDRMAVMSENRTELIDLVLGCAWIGAVVVPLNSALRGPGLTHQLSDSGARILAIEPHLVHILRDAAIPPTLERLWVFDGDTEPAGAPSASDLPVEPYPDSPGPCEPALVDAGTIAGVLYTSGTTGPAKGVQCPHAQFYWWGHLMAEQLELTENDILYTPLPIFHINALGAFFQALVSGATFHLGPRFSASRMMARLIDSRATVTYLLGAMVSILELQPPGESDRGHRVTRALAPSTSATQMQTFRERFGIELVEAYGSTETNAALGAPIAMQRAGWIGPVREGFDAIAADADDNTVPDGQPGELLLRSDHPYAMSSGYLGAPEKTVEAWRNLWFHTGDLVERSPDGWFRFLDRLSDSIRRRGENISSHEVEQAALSHPAVDRAAAYALPSELGEDEVAVAVIRNSDSSLTEEELVRWMETRVSYFAVPRYIQFVDDLPLTDNGKVRKSVLRTQGALHCWDRESAGVTVSRTGR